MKFKNKGRKIYKTKEKNYYGKSPAGKMFSALLTVILIGGIGFIGYSVAEPIMNYDKKQGDSETSIEPTTEFSLEAYYYEENETDTDSESNEETVMKDNTEVSSENETETASSTERPTLEEIEVKEPEVHEYYRAVSFTEYDILSLDSLNAAIDRIPEDQDIDIVEVPLKTRGGYIYFETYAEEAIISGAVQSRMTPDTIAQAIKIAGYTPVAVISTFRDHIVPMSFHEYSYNTTDDYSLWYDNSPDNGGKPWLSPFSEGSVNYLSAIASEAASAGFEKIVCSDFMFPPFRDTDLAMLDTSLGEKDRFRALTSAANQLYDTIISNGSAMILEVSAAELLKGNEEVLQPMLLNVNTVILNIDLDEINGGVVTEYTPYDFSGSVVENVLKMLGLVKDKLSDFNVVVRISGSSVSAPEMFDAKDAVLQEGYNSFVIG